LVRFHAGPGFSIGLKSVQLWDFRPVTLNMASEHNQYGFLSRLRQGKGKDKEMHDAQPQAG
jgi:hypothetical protein